MSDTIQDLYGSFSAQMEPIQEDDRYFRYLFEMAQASDTTLEQQREELVKVVDEEWIAMIEDSLDAINTIIEKPRRFITTEEEVVPVSLAKKISADSVRHLSQNTQFLAPSDDGGIHPTKILNVNMAETYDLYENRFVYHLIQRLLTFVDKRTDVIFWSTGNEIRNRFTMHSKIGDAYEEIEYNVEMTVKDRQNFAENDADNVDTFMRIDRVRRLVMALRNTSFCQIMQGCATVRSPIQRTNLIMKDPNYRKCYQLWQFMERYDKVGYNIEVKDSALAFDDEYMVQMYTNLINNYAVFKSLISDDRNITELASQQREPIEPKFVKEIKEEFVDSCDIPDVEVRRVFVEEVTQAQLDAEAALEEERAKCEELESQLKAWKVQAHALTDERDDLADELDMAKTREVTLTQRAQVAEADLEEARNSLADVEEGKRAAEEEAAKARRDAEAEIERMQVESATEVQTALDDAAAKVAAAKAEADAAVAAAKDDAEAKLAAAKDEAARQLKAAQDAAAEEVRAVQEDASLKVQAAEAAADARVEAAASDAAVRVASLEAAGEEAHKKAEAQISGLKAKLESDAESHKQALAQAEEQHAAEFSRMKQELEARVADLTQSLEQEQRARARAEKRAEGNKLSHYLLAKLRGENVTGQGSAAGSPAAQEPSSSDALAATDEVQAEAKGTASNNGPSDADSSTSSATKGGNR